MFDEVRTPTINEQLYGRLTTINVLIPFENISSINLLLNVIKATVVAVRNDSLAHGLELRKVIHYQTTEEGRPIL